MLHMEKRHSISKIVVESINSLVLAKPSLVPENTFSTCFLNSFILWRGNRGNNTIYFTDWWSFVPYQEEQANSSFIWQPSRSCHSIQDSADVQILLIAVPILLVLIPATSFIMMQSPIQQPFTGSMAQGRWRSNQIGLTTPSTSLRTSISTKKFLLTKACNRPVAYHLWRLVGCF